MNKGSDVASIVVNEQLSRMLEQEKKRLELLPILEPAQELPPPIKDQMAEILLRMVVVARISITARLN